MDSGASWSPPLSSGPLQAAAMGHSRPQILGIYFSCHSHHTQSSGSPTDCIEYPSISDFLALLVEKNPHRSMLRDYASAFEKHDFYNIDEVAGFSEDRLRGEEFKFSAGNALFFLKEVRAEIRRIDQENGKKKPWLE